jgi:hypothetical protein
MTISRYQTLNFGCNPGVLDLALTGSGTIQPQFKPGHVSYGDCEAEWVYCKLVLASTTDVLPGQVYYWDDDYTATLLATAASPRGCAVGVANVFAPQTVAGTYYIWLMRAGQGPVAYTTLTANNLLESTATAGALNSPASPTASSKAVLGITFTKSPATFTGTVTNGSPFITATSLTATAFDSGPFVGATITGTGIPASTIIGAIAMVNSAIQITMMSSSGALVNGTATNTGVTVTPAKLGECRIRWGFIDKTN